MRHGVLLLVLLLVAIIVAHLLVHVALVHSDGLLSPWQAPFPAQDVLPLCLPPQTSQLVVVPLLETDESAAALALADRLERLMQRTVPCRRHTGPFHAASSLPALVVATALSGSALSVLNATLHQGMRAVAHCFSAFEARAVAELRLHLSHQLRTPAAHPPPLYELSPFDMETTARTNEAFLGAVGLGRARRSHLLWLAPEAAPLRERWLETLQCEAEASGRSWISASALLMDCNQRWHPSAPCCATAGDDEPRRDPRGDPLGDSRGDHRGDHRGGRSQLSATGLYAAHDEGFVQCTRR